MHLLYLLTVTLSKTIFSFQRSIINMILKKKKINLPLSVELISILTDSFIYD